MRSVKTRVFTVFVLFVAFTVFAASDSFAQENEGFFKRAWKRFRREEPAPVAIEKKVPPPPPLEKVKVEKRKTLKDMSKEELIERIVSLLDDNSDILAYVPQIKTDKDADGNIYYTFTLDSGMIKRLQELDKSTLVTLAGRVGSEANRLNNERITRQLETIRRATGIPKVPTTPPQAVATPPQAVATPPQLPRVQTTPPPLPPTQPPTPPSVPTAPVAAPTGLPRR